MKVDDGAEVIICTEGSTFEEDLFYEVRTSKTWTQGDAKIPLIPRKELTVAISYGKKKPVEEERKKLRESMTEYAEKSFGVPATQMMHESVQDAVAKKNKELSTCRAFVLHNSKFNDRWGNGHFVVFDGARVRIVNHKRPEFDDVQEDSFAIFKKCAINHNGDEILLSLSSSIEFSQSEDSAKKQIYQQLYTLDHTATKSFCVIGRIISSEICEYNEAGVAYRNGGKYIIVRIQERGTKVIQKYKIWGGNVKKLSSIEANMTGQLVLIPTKQAHLTDENICRSAIALFPMKGYRKRSSDFEKDGETPSKIPPSPVTTKCTTRGKGGAKK